MVRFLLIVVGLKFLMIGGCSSLNNDDAKPIKEARIYFKGTLMNLNEKDFNAIVKQTENMIAEGETYCKYQATADMISHIRNNDQFLEINFSSPRFVMTDHFGKIEFTNVLIPLTGDFAKPGSVSVFYGISGFENSPVICSNGYHELRELIIGLDYL